MLKRMRVINLGILLCWVMEELFYWVNIYLIKITVLIFNLKAQEEPHFLEEEMDALKGADLWDVRNWMRNHAAAALSAQADGRISRVGLVVEPSDAFLDDLLAAVELDMLQVHAHAGAEPAGEIIPRPDRDGVTRNLPDFPPRRRGGTRADTSDGTK